MSWIDSGGMSCTCVRAYVGWVAREHSREDMREHSMPLSPITSLSSVARIAGIGHVKRIVKIRSLCQLRGVSFGEVF